MGIKTAMHDICQDEGDKWSGDIYSFIISKDIILFEAYAYLLFFITGRQE